MTDQQTALPRFGDTEREWLISQCRSPEIWQRISCNAPRIIDTDGAGNVTKAKRGRQTGDGALKGLAPDLAKAYLEVFNLPFTEESLVDFKAREKARLAMGVTHCHRQLAETQQQHERRIDFQSLSTRIYNWLRNNSPNKVRKYTRVHVTQASNTPVLHTAQSVFKMTGAPGSVPYSPPSGGIGQWATNMQQAFINQTAEEFQKLEQTAERLNRAAQLDNAVKTQLSDWSRQTGFGGFIVLGGQDASGEVRNFTIDNTGCGSELLPFAAHISRRFGITEQQWQTELDWYFQAVFNNNSTGQQAVEAEAALPPVSHAPATSPLTEEADTVPDDRPEVGEEVPIELEIPCMTVNQDQCSDSVEQGPEPLLINSDHRTEGHNPDCRTEERNSDVHAVEHSAEEQGLVHPSSRSLVISAPEGVVLSISGDGSSMDTGSQANSDHTACLDLPASSRTKRKRKASSVTGHPAKGPRRRSTATHSTATHSTATHSTASHVPTLDSVNTGKVTQSGRKITPKASGTAAYDEVVGRQIAASARHRKY
ncbi:hypothetical protein BDY19DRAFT_995892 [Irpex rosettiformis]|uniref:Uncharacterized protein n=1 Tax=Irpex rosettiformis TaxID=378272 RepID=A0ACB8TWC3_9APHY|nr:hypothetical protein BDY19DRAFT_995892 [Irpex rosettiformis]